MGRGCGSPQSSSSRGLSEGEAFTAGRWAIERARSLRRLGRTPLLGIPDFDAIALPHHLYVFGDAGLLAKRLRDEDSIAFIEFVILGMADDHALPPARLLVKGGQLLETPRYRLPVFYRIEK